MFREPTGEQTVTPMFKSDWENDLIQCIFRYFWFVIK